MPEIIEWSSRCFSALIIIIAMLLVLMVRRTRRKPYQNL
jgi:heme A synthase